MIHQEIGQRQVIYAHSEPDLQDVVDYRLGQEQGTRVTAIHTIEELKEAVHGEVPADFMIVRLDFFDQDVTPMVDFLEEVYGQERCTIPCMALTAEPLDDVIEQRLNLPFVTIGAFPQSSDDVQSFVIEMEQFLYDAA